MNYNDMYMVMITVICFVGGIMNIIFPRAIGRKPNRVRTVLMRALGIVMVLVSIAYVVLYVWRHYYSQ